MSEVFISQMAQVSSLGGDLAVFWQRLRAGASGAVKLTANFSTEPEFPVARAHLLGEDVLPLPPREANLFYDESVMVARHLIREVTRGMKGRKTDGLLWGHGQLGFKFGNRRNADPAQMLDGGRWRETLRDILRSQGVTPPAPLDVINHSNACITGISLLREAAWRIRRGEWQRAVVVVQELRCRDWVLWPYYKLGLLSPGEAQPFTRERNGFNKGEGGAAFLLESAGARQESGSRPYCRVSGAAFSASADKMLEPGAALLSADGCVRDALALAGLTPKDVDCVHAYGSASGKGDAMEARLIHQIFGERASQLPVTASKSAFGHLNTAAAAIEILALALMINEQTLAPVAGMGTPDPELDLAAVRGAPLPLPIRHAVKLAFGFGWSSGALVLSAC